MDTLTSFWRAVTELVFIRDEPVPADVIFVPGSERRLHVDRAAELWKQGYAPWVLPSGCHAIGQTLGIPDMPSEWAWMRRILLEQGVPDRVILREDRATYTWENAKFSRAVCDEHGLTVRRGLLCCKSYHARRALIYYQTAFPETVFSVCPADEPGFGPEDWFRTPEGRERILGEVRRLGDQITPQLKELIDCVGNGDR